MADWRPITVLPALSKALETIVADQIVEFLDTNNLLAAYQSGFRHKHSTCTALTKVVTDIRTICDEGNQVIHILLDFSKAFDSVRHQLLIHKLQALFKFSTSACALISSYLNNRSQAVVSNGRRSLVRHAAVGVPQGSVLAPLLFSAFINDITAAIPNVQYHLYADDLQIYSSGPTDSLPALITSLNRTLDNISLWCTRNSLTLNPLKTQAIVYGIRPRPLDSLPPLRLEGQPIQLSSDHVKNLGILMDCGLTWHAHISRMCSRVYFGLRSLYAISDHIPQHIRGRLVEALILPHLFYGDIALYPLQNTALGQIQRALRACVRYIHGLGRYTHTTPLVDALLHGPLPKIYELRALCFILKSRLNLLPGYIKDKISWSRLDNSRIVLPRSRTHFGGKSVFEQGASLWNSLPQSIRQNLNLKQFKSLSLQYLIDEP